MWKLALVVALMGCEAPGSNHIYSRGADHDVLCGKSVDNKNKLSLDAVSQSMDHAQVEHLVLHLYSHRPAGTVDEATIELVIAAAADRNMPFVTYKDLLDGATEGLAFSFDDHDLVGWHALRQIFDLYGAKVTFFISAFPYLTDDDKAKLRDLANDGHDIQYHSTNHENAETYTAAYGLETYVRDDILPGLAAMRAEGYDPRVMAYPFGARTEETDAELLTHFDLLRAISSTCPWRTE